MYLQFKLYTYLSKYKYTCTNNVGRTNYLSVTNYYIEVLDDILYVELILLKINKHEMNFIPNKHEL